VFTKGCIVADNCKVNRINRYIILFSSLALLSARLLSAQPSHGPAGRSDRERFVQAAQEFLGTPYVRGGTNNTGMDCSGLVFRAALNSMGRTLPRTVAAQAAIVERITHNQAMPADLVFFNTVGNLTHVGIYIGDGQFIHSASEGPHTGVIISRLSEPYWQRTYAFTGRLFPAEALVRTPPRPVPATPSAKATPSISESAEDPAEQEVRAVSLFDYDIFPFEGQTGFRVGITGAVLWDFVPGTNPIRGFKTGAHISWIKGLHAYPGVLIALYQDSRQESLSMPVALSLTSRSGFGVYIGTQFHFFAQDELNRSLQFPGIIGFSWTSMPARLGNQRLRFYQDIGYSHFPDETFGFGLRFTSGLQLSFDI